MGTPKMSAGQSNVLSRMQTACGTLLYELQMIWDEVGESDAEKDRMLLELEQECLEVCRRKVDGANKCRAQLRQAIDDAEAELAAICYAMGEQPVHIRQTDQNPENLKFVLRAILPQLEEMRKRRIDRKKQFIKVLDEIQGIKNEICRSNGLTSKDSAIDESDLSTRRLEELQRELRALQKEKSKRLKLVHDYLSCLYSLCLVLGLDFKKTVSDIHPSLGDAEGSKDISDGVIEQLGAATQKLRTLKIQRMQQLQDLATSLLELWDLMDTPVEEQQRFRKVTCNLVASEDEITESGILSFDYINYVKAEVSRLEELKVSKMKELVLKKKAELEVICRKTHLIPDADGSMAISIDDMESGAVDAACVLEQFELQMARIKEEALSRKDILEKVEKWVAACEEESWLEEYNRDENRYNAGRGAHLMLKRAEKARALINKIPAMVDTLASKALTWESEKGVEFTYDGVPLLSMLEGYTALRKEKELERKRQRDHKKLQGQLLTEQEAIYGSKPSPVKSHNMKKGPKLSCGGASNKKLSLGAPMQQTPKPPPSVKATPNTRNGKKKEHVIQKRLTEDGFAAPSSGRRGLDMAGLPVKRQCLNSLNASEQELPVMRKPFSPISAMNASMVNATNVSEDMNQKHHEILHQALTVYKTPFATPSKIISSAEEENRTPPTMAITVPSTPLTVSVLTEAHVTPSPPIQGAIIPDLSTVKPVEDGTEYSFEERRAGFKLPRSRPVIVIQQ